MKLPDPPEGYQWNIRKGALANDSTVGFQLGYYRTHKVKAHFWSRQATVDTKVWTNAVPAVLAYSLSEQEMLDLAASMLTELQESRQL